MVTTRIVIVEDEVLYRDLLCRSLADEPGLEIVGQAEGGEDAIRLIKETEPDVVLVDIELPGEINGIDVAVNIKKQRPQTGIVILTAHSDLRYLSCLPLRDSGGWAYLLKQTVSGVTSLVDAIERTRTGMIVLDPEIANKLKVKQGSAIARLSPSKREVLQLIAQGYNNATIAQKLNLSVKSVENYINGVYQELNLTGMSEVHARVKATLLYLADS